MKLIPDKPRAVILGVASLEPRSAAELYARADHRRPLDILPRSAVNVCRWLAEQGYLRRTHIGTPGGRCKDASLYVITPEGEAALDALYQP